MGWLTQSPDVKPIELWGKQDRHSPGSEDHHYKPWNGIKISQTDLEQSWNQNTKFAR